MKTIQANHIFIEEAAQIYGITTPNFYARMKQSRAPEPVGKVGRRNVWDRETVQAWSADNKRKVACTADDLASLRAFVERLDESVGCAEGKLSMPTASYLKDAQQMLEQSLEVLAECPTNTVTEALVRIWRRVLEERAT